MATRPDPTPRSADPPGTPRSLGARGLAFFRAHPIVCLAVLTPGLPEYLSTSSPLLNLAVNPFWFFLGLAINVGQYTAGALLIREVVVRYHKGWGTVALLSLAYGVTEEGLGDNTLFNSNHGADGILGSYGRFGGVNWVWSTGVLAFHMSYSIGLPILLLGLALPATRGRSLVGRRGLALALCSLAASTGLETAIVFGSSGFWMGTPLLVGSLLTIAVLVYGGFKLPASWGRPTQPVPSLSARWAGCLGFGVFPVLFLLEYGGAYLRVPAAAIVAVELLFLANLVRIVRNRVGLSANEYLLVNLAFGFVVWQAVFGLLLTLGLPYSLPLVVVAVWFFLRLRRAYAPTLRPAAPPPGATPAAGG